MFEMQSSLLSIVLPSSFFSNDSYVFYMFSD